MSPLPLPYRILEPLDHDAIQGNFDEIAKQFLLSRKNMAVEAPHEVGAVGEPAFQNSWINYDPLTFEVARFWKDPVGMVHIEGLVKLGTIGTPIFTLPAGYRPGNGHLFAIMSNSALGRLDVAPTGNVVAISGNNTWFQLSGTSFRQEA